MNQRTMYQLKTGIQNFLLRQLQIVFLVLFTFFTLLTFAFANSLPAHAQVMTPEEYSDLKYRSNMQEFNNDKLTFKQQKRDDLQAATDNIREKLNLDEEAPESTKEFLDSVQTKVEETVEPITQSEHGYYQYHIPAKK